MGGGGECIHKLVQADTNGANGGQGHHLPIELPEGCI